MAWCRVDSDRRFRAMIVFHPKLTDACITTQHIVQQQPNDRAALQKARGAQFALASAICHEMAHVIANFYFGRERADKHPYHNGQAACEVGYAYEKFVLGDSVFTSSSGDVMLRDWPNKEIMEKYSSSGWPMGVRDQEAVSEPRVRYACPERIAAFFGKELWEAKGGRSLKPLYIVSG